MSPGARPPESAGEAVVPGYIWLTYYNGARVLLSAEGLRVRELTEADTKNMTEARAEVAGYSVKESVAEIAQLIAAALSQNGAGVGMLAAEEVQALKECYLVCTSLTAGRKRSPQEIKRLNLSDAALKKLEAFCG